MMRLFTIVLCCFIYINAGAQQTVSVKITGENNEPVQATVLVRNTSIGAAANDAGLATISFPSNGKYSLVVSATGFKEAASAIIIPYPADTIFITLIKEEEDMEEVIIQSTRTGRSISNVPTRVEVIDLEEIDEKTNMRPANVAMILHESTGIQVQQTSATSGNASIRLQGLDGKYTQLLKDGFPNFGNFSGGLSILEIPPLDLKQVEIIKGPASTLFGGGAIAGVVNFISVSPKEKPVYSFILNQSNIGQTNIGGFASQRKKKMGYTLLALYNKERAYDVDQDDFTEVPLSDEFTVHPKLFFYPDEKTSIILGNSFTKTKRTGGDVYVIKGNADASHQYTETNKTIRNISTLEYAYQLNPGKRITAKQSFSIFDRSIQIPSYLFAGKEYNAYSELSFSWRPAKHSLVSGINFLYNRFAEKNTLNKRDYTGRTGGLYLQDTWDINEKIKLESGLRLDATSYKNNIYSKSEFFMLPRVSLLLKYNSKLSSRIGAGLGYKSPTMFTEESETIQYQHVQQLNRLNSERSYGSTADLNYRTKFGNDFSFSLNHMFFFTLIKDPIVLNENAGDFYFSNNGGSVYSTGFETNAKLIFKENFKLFLGYTFTESKVRSQNTAHPLSIVPKGKLNTALIYEKEGSLKLGLEGYFTGRQYLSNGSRTPAFAEYGFMAEKLFRKFSVFINFENISDTRQSRYKAVVNGSHLNPTFDEIWTHTEGFVWNAGVKLKF